MNLSFIFKHLKKAAKQAFDSKANEHVNAFLFGKFPVAIQIDLSVAGKQGATMDEIRDFIPRQSQCRHLIGTKQPQPFNEVSSGFDKRQTERLTRKNSNQQRKFSATCFHCIKKGHKAFDCRTRKREHAQKDVPHTKSSEQRPQRVQNKPAQEKWNFNLKLVCQICGYTGHSALTCRHRNTNTNANKSIPYQRQNPNDNRGFRKDFKQANKR